MANRTARSLSWAIQPQQVLWKLSDRVRQFGEARSLNPTAALGRRGEDLAHRYLQRAGFRVIARNYKPGEDSEVDIVARLGEKLIFVEVKTRASSDVSAPERAIDEEKENRIRKAARAFATRAGIDHDKIRFDVVSVVLNNPPTIAHFEDAFYG